MPPRLPAVRWPTLLLLTSIGFTALGLVEASRAIRSQRAVAEHALRDYASFAAWSYEQHLRDDIERAIPANCRVLDVCRRESPSGAHSSIRAHRDEQQRLVAVALGRA